MRVKYWATLAAFSVLSLGVGGLATGCSSANPCAGVKSGEGTTPATTQVKENPCAAKNNPCAGKENPCAAKSNPCAGKVNPCAAKANPCAGKANPCAAKGNPCAGK